MIRVVNRGKWTPKPGEVAVDVMRTSPLGNPFYMKANTHAERSRVCDEYAEWLPVRYTDPNSRQHCELEQIATMAVESDVALVCCCLPKRCHAATIKNLVEKIIWARMCAPLVKEPT